jgi:hypothetical protein
MTEQIIKVKPWYLRSKFWVACATGVLGVLNEGLGLGIPTDVYWSIVTLALGYIFGEAFVDGKRAGK